MNEPVRPREGKLVRASGEVIELRFVETDEPGVFLAVTVDGEAVYPRHRDRVNVDALDAGQSVRFLMELPGPPPREWRIVAARLLNIFVVLLALLVIVQAIRVLF